jgi:hypothetical protein
MEEKDFLDLKNKNIYIRKVLVEKYSKEYMINWIKKQKNIDARKQEYDSAARLRRIERLLLTIEIDINHDADKQYFSIFENR